MICMKILTVNDNGKMTRSAIIPPAGDRRMAGRNAQVFKVLQRAQTTSSMKNNNQKMKAQHNFFLPCTSCH